MFLYEFLSKNPCVDCREDDPIVLTFDHIKDKSFVISQHYVNVKKEKLLEEMKKCEIRCSNCHLKKTAKDFNWYTYRFKNKLN